MRRDIVRCLSCTHWVADDSGLTGVCMKHQFAAGASFTCPNGAKKGSQRAHLDAIRRNMEDMIRIANRHGFLCEECREPWHVVMRHRDTRELLEIELLETT